MNLYRLLLAISLALALCSCALVAGLKSQKDTPQNKSKGTNVTVSPQTGVYRAPSTTGENTGAKLIKPLTP